MADGIVEVALGHAEPRQRFVTATVTPWKLLATGGVLWICWTGGRSVVAWQAVVFGQLAWMLGERLYAAPPADATPVASGISTIVLWMVPLLLLRPHRRQLLHLRANPSAVLLPRANPSAVLLPLANPSAVLLQLALAAADPLTIYSVHHGQLATEPTRADSFYPYDTPVMGVVLAVQLVLAALRPGRTVWLPRLVSLAAAWMGLAAIAWQHVDGSFGRAWGAALVVAAVTFIFASEAEARRDRL